MIDGTVTLTLLQVDALRKESSDLRIVVDEKNEIIKELESKQRKVLLLKSNPQIELGAASVWAADLRRTDTTLNLRTKTGTICVSAYQAANFAEQLVKANFLKVGGTDEKSYVNFEDVREELRAELEQKLDEKYHARMADADAKYEVLDKKLARQAAQHAEKTVQLKDDHSSEVKDLKDSINDWQKKYTLLKEGKKEENTIQALQEEIARLNLIINKKPWWKFWQ